MPKAQIRLKDTKVETIVTIIERVNMSDLANTITKTTLIGITIIKRMIKVGLIFPHKMRKFLLRTVEVVWSKLRICYRR